MQNTILIHAPGRRQGRGTLVLAYTALFALLMGIWAAIFALNGQSFIQYGDTLKQHYPFLVYYGRWLRQVARCVLPEAELTGDTVSPAAEMELDGVQQLDETTYYAPQDGGRITLTIAQPVADCETAFVVQGMQYTATSPLDAMNEEELSAMSAHDRRSLQKQYAHFWRKDSVYLRLLSNIGEGRIEYNRPNSQYYCGRHDFVYNFGTSDEPLQQITIVLPFAGYYQFDRLAVECQKLDTVAARAENLGAENLQNVTLGTNSLGGEITTTRSSVLVVQLPYSTGWSVTVDGTPAQVLRADTAFLGVALEPGSHTVAFTYKTPGLTAGAALSAAGVVLLAAIWAVPALRKKSKKRRK